jgi:hypothetical protein
VGYRPEGRPENDFYPTPREGTTGLLDNMRFSGTVWEPACGDGAMVKVLEEYGYSVIPSDIEPRGCGYERDFLQTMVLQAPNIITNPPFRLAQQFAMHALDLRAEKVALLCKLAFLETQERASWLESSPLAKVMVFKKRLTLYREGIKLKNGGMIAFAWFVWEREWIGKPVLSWI